MQTETEEGTAHNNLSMYNHSRMKRKNKIVSFVSTHKAHIIFTCIPIICPIGTEMPVIIVHLLGGQVVRQKKEQLQSSPLQMCKTYM